MVERNLYTAKRWTAEEAREVLDDWKTSQLPLCTFAERHELPEPRLERWRRRLGYPSQTEGTRFAEVIVKAPIEPPQHLIEIELPNDVRVRVSASIDPVILRNSKMDEDNETTEFMR